MVQRIWINLSNLSIKEYSYKDRDSIEKFRMLCSREGNFALTTDKYDPDMLDGKTFMTFVDDELASISVIERSHYTNDPQVTGRICRYHILKKYRHCHAGFRMLPYQVEWAKKSGMKVLYWTHDVDNRALNSLYQHKRRMPMRGQQVAYFNDSVYKSFQLQKNMLFKVAEKSNMLQYIYASVLDPSFSWQPISNHIVYIEHNGNIDEETLNEIQRTTTI